MAKAAAIGGPGDQRHLRLDALQPLLRPNDEIFHSRIGPGLVAPKGGIVKIGRGDLGPRLGPVVLPAVGTPAAAAMVEAIEAEGVDIRVLGENLFEDGNEKLPIRPQRAEHSPVAELLHVDGGDLKSVGGDPPPVGMGLIHLPLERGRIDREDPHPEPLVLGDLLLDLPQCHMGAALVEELAVVIRIERIDKVHLADRHAVPHRLLALLPVHPRERVADAGRLPHPGRDLDWLRCRCRLGGPQRPGPEASAQGDSGKDAKLAGHGGVSGLLRGKDRPRPSSPSGGAASMVARPGPGPVSCSERPAEHGGRLSHPRSPRNLRWA